MIHKYCISLQILHNLTGTAYGLYRVIRGTLISVPSQAKFEGKDIRSITGHKSGISLESYTGLPSFGKYVEMAENLSNFIDKENRPSTSAGSSRNMSNTIHAGAQTTPDQYILQPILQSMPSGIAEKKLFCFESSGLKAPLNNFHSCSVQVNCNLNLHSHLN